MNIIEQMSFVTASMPFSTKTIPENFHELEEEEQQEWLEDHKWANVEDLSNDEFYSLIEDHANSINGAMVELLKIVQIKLVKAAIENTLPDDFNELDLVSMLTN